MDPEQKKKLFEAVVNELQYKDDARIYENYSGRGMYENKTIAIVTDTSGVEIGFAFAVAAEQLGMTYSEVENELPLREDNMGCSRIYY